MGTLLEQNKTPLKLVIKRFVLVEEKARLSNHATFSPCRYEVNKKSNIPMRNSKINPLVVKSLLESIFKRFRKSVVRENFNLKRDPQMRKSHSN